MSAFNSTKFKKLQAKYYKKLKESGFRDLEDEGGKFRLSTYELSRRIGFRSVLYEAIRDYYYWATDMLVLGCFKSKTELKIWSLHAQGLTSREIAQQVPWDQTYICRKIKKIKAYLREQARKREQAEAIAQEGNDTEH